MMLGHYFFFLTHVHGNIYFWIGAIFAKFNGIGIENDRESIHCFLGINILLIWLAIKHQYYFPFEAFAIVSAKLLRSMAYFYSLLCPGESLNMLNLLSILILRTACFFRDH